MVANAASNRAIISAFAAALLGVESVPAKPAANARELSPDVGSASIEISRWASRRSAFKCRRYTSVSVCSTIDRNHTNGAQGAQRIVGQGLLMSKPQSPVRKIVKAAGRIDNEIAPDGLARGHGHGVDGEVALAKVR